MSYESTTGHHSPSLTVFRGPYINLSFQDGPIPEYGENGTTNEEIIQLLIDRIISLNSMADGRYASDFNANAIFNLRMALRELNARTEERKRRGVEGTMVP